jgi:hypothetical protein
MGKDDGGPGAAVSGIESHSSDFVGTHSSLSLIILAGSQISVIEHHGSGEISGSGASFPMFIIKVSSDGSTRRDTNFSVFDIGGWRASGSDGGLGVDSVFSTRAGPGGSCGAVRA